MQQQDLWLDVLPARVALPRRYCLRYLKVEVKALSRKFRLQFDEIALETVTLPAARTRRSSPIRS